MVAEQRAQLSPARASQGVTGDVLTRHALCAEKVAQERLLPAQQHAAQLGAGCCFIVQACSAFAACCTACYAIAAVAYAVLKPSGLSRGALGLLVP
jgi:hypothetical protein